MRGQELGLCGSFLEAMRDEANSAYILYVGIIFMILVFRLFTRSHLQEGLLELFFSPGSSVPEEGGPIDF